MFLLLRHLAAFFAFLAVVLALPRGAFVVCLNESGHRAVEVSCSEFAHPAAASPAEAAPRTCKDECGACTDSPLGADQSASRITSGRERIAPAPLAVAPTPLASAFALAPGTLRRHEPAALLGSPARHHSTVVLRL